MFRFIKFWIRYNLDKDIEEWSALFRVAFVVGTVAFIFGIPFYAIYKLLVHCGKKQKKFWEIWREYKRTMK